MIDVGMFFGTTLATMFGGTFFLGVFAFVIVALLLILIRSPAPFTLMMAFVAFALIAGFNNPLLKIAITPLSSDFFPILALIILIIAGVLAYALWRVFES